LLFAIGNTLTDSANYITSFADAHTYLTALIANNDDRAKTQLFTAFNNLADAADLDNPFLPGGVFLFGAATFSTSCHSFILLFVVCCLLFVGRLITNNQQPTTTTQFF
jgi:hypothetical protein